MVALIDLLPWVDRLKSECPAFADRVFLTVPSEALDIYRHQSPAAFVYLAEDASDEPRPGRKIVRQKNRNTVTVETVVRRTATQADPFSEADWAVIMQARGELFNALLGWAAPGCLELIAHRSGKVRKESKLLKWADNFTAEILMTSG